MSKSQILLILGIIVLVGGFGTVDYRLLTNSGFDQQAVIANVLPSPIPALTLSPVPARQAIVVASSSYQIPVATAAPVCTIKEYRFLENTDPCKIASWIKKGWDIYQMGSVIDLNGQQADCSTYSPYGMDSVVLVHEVPNPSRCN